MPVLDILSKEEMLKNLRNDENNYVLLYKKGSEVSDCSYNSLKEVINQNKDITVMAADVNVVRDIHTAYNITSAPSLLIFKGLDFIKADKGCNKEEYYLNLLKSRLYKSENKAGEKPQKRVKVYTTPTCSWCKTIKRHLDQNGIRYSEVDVSKDQKAAEAMVKRSGQQGVPQTEIGGEIIVGFDKNRINSLLGIAN